MLKDARSTISFCPSIVVLISSRLQSIASGPIIKLPCTVGVTNTPFPNLVGN